MNLTAAEDTRLERRSDHLEHFQQNRKLLFSIAYRMLGSVEDAQDVVQETYIRFSGHPLPQLRNPQGFLVTILTRLAIDARRSAYEKRKAYPGPWLPEPMLDGFEESMVLSQSAGAAFLLLLELLSPVERAVIVLRDVFDFEYNEIADFIEKKPDHCRKIAERARKRIRKHRDQSPLEAWEGGAGQVSPFLHDLEKNNFGQRGASHSLDARSDLARSQGIRKTDSNRTGHSSDSRKKALLKSFQKACISGDLTSLMELLASDVKVHSDGGGRIAAALRVVAGADPAGRFFIGLAKKMPGSYSVPVKIGGELSVLVFEADHSLSSVVQFRTDRNRIAEVYAMRNPDKLKSVQASIRKSWKLRAKIWLFAWMNRFAAPGRP